MNPNTLTSTRGMASNTSCSAIPWAKPQGVTSTLRKMQIRTKNFIAPAHFIRAAPRPEYSSPFERSIIASSNWPEGLSTGIRPSSAMINIRKAIINRMWEGSKKLAIGVTQRV